RLKRKPAMKVLLPACYRNGLALWLAAQKKAAETVLLFPVPDPCQVKHPMRQVVQQRDHLRQMDPKKKPKKPKILKKDLQVQTILSLRRIRRKMALEVVRRETKTLRMFLQRVV